MLKVAVDGGPLRSGDSVRGIGTYVRELTAHLKGADVVDITEIDLKKYNIIHLTRFSPFRLSVPFAKPKGIKFVLTIYDLIPLIYPSHYPPGIRGWFKWQVNKYSIRKNVDAIITISETSKKDICRFLGINPDKVFVTYLAARDVFSSSKKVIWGEEIREKYRLPKKFALYVGDINYNKNIPNLVEACRLAETPLVIVGKQAKKIDAMDLDYPELTHLKGIDLSDVIRPGFVPDDDLVKIYNLALLYVQASFYEGFGLPLLEALACQTPIAVSKNQCHVEILGNGFRYFDPHDPKDIAASILKPNKVTKVPRLYSWAKTAGETTKVYEKI